jgi:hypothetical protein
MLPGWRNRAAEQCSSHTLHQPHTTLSVIFVQQAKIHNITQLPSETESLPCFRQPDPNNNDTLSRYLPSASRKDKKPQLYAKTPAVVRPLAKHWFKSGQ